MSELAGRVLDGVVAKRVMGLQNVGWWLSGEMRHGPQHRAEIVPYYSTDIAAAWEVVEKMMLREDVPGFEINVFKHEGVTHYCVEFGACWKGCIYAEVEADTAPLAICRAALAACGGDES